MTKNELKTKIDKLDLAIKSGKIDGALLDKMKTTKEKLNNDLLELEAKDVAMSDIKADKGIKEKKITTVKKGKNKKTVKTEKIKTENIKPEKDKINNASIKEGVKEQHISKDLQLLHIKGDVYDLLYKGQSSFSFEKRTDKWHVTCKIDERNRKDGFTSLEEAVKYVSKHIYSDELKQYLKQKKASAKRNKEFREKHKSGATTPNQDLNKAENKVIKKITEKAKENKDVTKDVELIFSNVNKLIVEAKAIIKEAKLKIDKSEIRKMISELKKLL